MSDRAANLTAPQAQAAAIQKAAPTVWQIFVEFLTIGATSFGGGVVAYLRSGLVGKREWLDDKEFLEMLSISQTLPGLNATNMAVLVGDKLRGFAGALAAIIGICLPGATVMYVVALVYHAHGDRPLAVAALKGVAATAVGLLLATCVQLSKKSLSGNIDLLFIVLTVIGVNRLHQSVPRVLFAVGLFAIVWYRPHKNSLEGRVP